MLRIIDSLEEFDKFSIQLQNSESVWFGILADDESHPLKNTLSLLFIRMLDINEDYVLCFNHSESKSILLENLNRLQLNKRAYIFDKKSFLHFSTIFNQLIDVSSVSWIMNNIPFNIDEKYPSVFWLLKRNASWFRNIHTLIPIYKWHQFLRPVFDNMNSLLLKASSVVEKPYFAFFNDLTIQNLQKTEVAGIAVNREKAIEYWGEGIDKYIHNGLMYSQYNMFTTTGRPSNSFGGVNFAALNKKDGARDVLQSRFGSDGLLIEFDFDAYHLRLIGDIVGYKFPTEISVHDYLAKQYGSTYEESKKLSFTYLYGGIPREIAEVIPYFSKVSKYTNTMWNDFQKHNLIKTYIYNRELTKETFPEITKNTFFNYLIQILETESNMMVMKDLHVAMSTLNSKFVLYTYDSFLFDVHRDELKIILRDVAPLLRRDKYPIKIKYGTSYNTMKKIG